MDEETKIDSIPKWFPGVKLNWAENVLFCGDSEGKPTSFPGKYDEKVACTEVREGASREPIRHITWKQLRRRTGQLEQAMKAHGVRKGDRVAAISSVSIDTLCVFLAASALGAIFSSTSTDMGAKGVLDRLTQIQPKFVFMEDGARYNGRTIDLRGKMAEVMRGMKQVALFEGLVSMPRWAHLPADVSRIPQCQTWEQFLSTAESCRLEFEQLQFCEPLLIVYSSGTTGQPKCIVHSVGGVVLNGYKEVSLHREISADSSQLQYTTTGWIMYLAATQALLTGCRMVMFDGSPFMPDATTFLRLVADQQVTHLGISPRYLQTLKECNIIPKQAADLSRLQVLTSTGMVLSEALFEWVYDVGFPQRVQLDNIAGGTDLAGCFACSNAISPLYVGGCQGPALGMAVSVFDTISDGQTGAKGRLLPDGSAGELVCTKAFPTMPIMFWGDHASQRYFSSYFEKFQNCWTHGDFISIHPRTRQILFHGRADGVLNPSGVRFGSSDIYAVVEAQFADEVEDSICVGQRRPQDHDESVMLFLLMKPGRRFLPSLIRSVKDAIKKELGPRCVPRFVFETHDIPVRDNAARRLDEFPLTMCSGQ